MLTMFFTNELQLFKSLSSDDFPAIVEATYTLHDDKSRYKSLQFKSVRVPRSYNAFQTYSSIQVLPPNS